MVMTHSSCSTVALVDLLLDGLSTVDKLTPAFSQQNPSQERLEL